MNKQLIKMGAMCELARRNFFWFCNLLAPDFYKPNRKYLVDICNDMQKFYESDDEVLIVNCPPRHGKSRTASLFVEWILGKNNDNKIMTGSYNETLSTQFSKSVRNTIQEEKADQYKPVYSDVFPYTRIKRGDGAMNLWSLEGGYNNYLATSPSGTATGFGANIIVLDDIIKNAEEACNKNVKEKHWSWFTDTMLSRLEENGKLIIIMTRWASDDLAGLILDWCKKENKKYQHINLKAITNMDKKEMLCDEVLSYKSAISKKSAMGAAIFSANYQQIPIDLEGSLYTTFKGYKNEDIKIIKPKAYIDTADKGEDYLCCIVYVEYEKEVFILDVVYTQESMAKTEPLVAECLYRNEVRECTIEGNNGGEGFARSITRILKEIYDSNKCVIKTFHQSKNKEARILSNASWIMEHVYYPLNWRNKWPEFYDALFSYQEKGKNAHDDAPDALTGVVEQVLNKTKKVKTRLNKGMFGL